jgi:fluoroacetyl-CoA thioesterase
MVGLLEWTCIQATNPHIDWPSEQSVGIHINVSHVAATPPGLEVTAKVRLMRVEGRKLTFEVEAHDGIELICRGIHDRFIIYPERFNEKVEEKASARK